MEFTGEIPKHIGMGYTTRIKLELGELKMAILIPRAGFYQRTGGQWVYIVNEEKGFANKRNIRIGR